MECCILASSLKTGVIAIVSLRLISLGLQQENADVVQALDDIDDVIAVLSRWRDEAEQEFGLLFGEVRNVAFSLGISIEKPRTTVRSRYRSNARPVP